MNPPSVPGSVPASRLRSGYRFRPGRFARFAALNARLAAQPAPAATAPASARGRRKGREAAGAAEVRWLRPSGLPGRIAERATAASPEDWDRLGDWWQEFGGGAASLGDSWEAFGDQWQPFGDTWGPFGAGAGDPPGVATVGLGYHADLPDFRDHTKQHHLDPFLKSAGGMERRGRPRSVGASGPAIPWKLGEGFRHLRQFSDLPEVENQGSLQSCTAHAVGGMAELLLLRYTGVPLDLSRMFLYKCTRRLLGWQGDTGAFIRTTIKALRLFGSLPESQWPYRAELLEAEPDAFVYAYARSFRALEYARLDAYGATAEATLQTVKDTLDQGHPAAFGFPLFSSVADMGPDYVIPTPREGDERVGGHAVIAVGYNDQVAIRDAAGNETSQGALIIRNSWGPAWGDRGYAYLPYWYVLHGMAVDFWTLYSVDWINEAAFAAKGVGQ